VISGQLLEVNDVSLVTKGRDQCMEIDFAEARAIARDNVSAMISHIITPCRKIRVRANLVLPLKLSSVVVRSEVKDAIK